MDRLLLSKNNSICYNQREAELNYVPLLNIDADGNREAKKNL
jgi:hypothetical protein